MISDTFWKLFGMIGIVAAVAFTGGFVYCIISSIKTWVYECLWKYKYKHRFDKKPIAVCYCKDCTYHINDGDLKNKCNLPGTCRYTPDNGFCYEAEPKKIVRG